MIEKAKLKNILLQTNFFVNNEYLDKYIEVVLSGSVSVIYNEKHHIIPVSVYKMLYSCSSRAAALKLANEDKNNAVVLLSYKEHCLAHCLLYFCTEGKLKQDSARTVWLMTKHLNKILNIANVDFDDIYEYIAKIKDDPKNSCFSSQEDKFILENYHELGVIKCAKYLNRPIGSVATRAKYLGVKSKINYTQEEKDFISKYYPLYGSKYCANKLGRSFTAIQKYAEATLKISGKTREKGIYCIELDKSYKSAAEAANELNILRTSIANCLTGLSKSAGGYHWKYIEEQIIDEERKSKN